MNKNERADEQLVRRKLGQATYHVSLVNPDNLLHSVTCQRI